MREDRHPAGMFRRWAVLALVFGVCLGSSRKKVSAVLEPSGLYELTGEVPDLDGPVLIQALTGFVDAGSAIQLSREHLVEHLEGRKIATFDVDQLLDYRSRRPPMIFIEDHWASYEQP